MMKVTAYENSLAETSRQAAHPPQKALFVDQRLAYVRDTTSMICFAA
jgi:hypothetical protein